MPNHVQTDTEYICLKHYSSSSKVGRVDRNLNMVHGVSLPRLYFMGKNEAHPSEMLVWKNVCVCLQHPLSGPCV